VGTHEFVDLCKRVGSEPLYCVNFLSDGRKPLWNAREGNRSGDAREAADWVSYCNDPDHAERRKNGSREPLTVRFWQIGNETSYGSDRFSKTEAIKHTIDFAKAMRSRDKSLKLIGWGDWRRNESPELWAADMVENAGEYIDYVAIHLMGQRPIRKDTVLHGNRYQFAPQEAWSELLELSENVEKRVVALEQAVRGRKPLAITEGHLSVSPHNANPILLEWLSAVYHARSMNIYERHGAQVKIATAADYCGNRWTVNAVMLQVPRGISYFTPAGSVMRLFGKNRGKNGVAITRLPDGLDCAASIASNTIWLHVANTQYDKSVNASFAVAGLEIVGGQVLSIAPTNLRQMVTQDEPEVFSPKQNALSERDGFRWSFPAGSVSVVQLQCKSV
jgi:alpha-L-arabinofuranosidase